MKLLDYKKSIKQINQRNGYDIRESDFEFKKNITGIIIQ
jgi:hypothetical protein